MGAVRHFRIIVALLGLVLSCHANGQSYEHAQYLVFGKSGAAGPQVLASDPWDPIASPRTWLFWPELPDNPDRPGAYRRTSGNNANVGLYMPSYWGNGSSLSLEPTSVAGDTLIYEYAYDSSKPDGNSANMLAATINAFYWVNRLHDVYWHFGFDEAVGNMQRVNLTGSGLGNDRVAVTVSDAIGDSVYNPAVEGSGSPFITYRMSFTQKHMALDLGVIAHEYHHGVDQRLLGTPYDYDAHPYATEHGMFTEASADFAALLFTQLSADAPNMASSPFAYSAPNARRLPFSYDMSINNQTLGLLDTDLLILNRYKSYNNAELWTSVLWDLNKVLIDKYGYAEDLIVGYDSTPGANNAGNAVVLKMLLTAYDTLPDNSGIPIFSVRDAMFAADQTLTGGDNLVELWRVFARRGWGYSAQIVGAGAVEAFDLPPNLSGYVAGDFDDDGDVDGRDFLEWQRHFGSRTSFWADGNLDGIVDAADYTIWRDNYGQGGNQTLAAVPEPGSAGLLAIGVASALGLNRSRRDSFSVAA